MKELFYEREGPGVFVGGGHGGEPHLPVEAGLIGGDLGRTVVEGYGQGLVVIFQPVGAVGGDAVGGAFENYVETFFAHGAEGAVGVDEVEGIEGSVHDLLGGEHVEDGLDAEQADDSGDDPGGSDHRFGGLGGCFGCCGFLDDGFWEDLFPEAVVEAGEGGNDGEPVEKGEVTAQDQDDLEEDHDDTGDMAGDAGPEGE